MKSVTAVCSIFFVALCSTSVLSRAILAAPTVPENDLASPLKKELAMQLVSSAENSSVNWRAQYAYLEDIGDGRGYTGGIIGFCSGTGDMLEVVVHYTTLAPTNKLAKYLPALRKVNGTDSHRGLDSNFVKDWKSACNDPLFQKSQEWERDTVYFNPAVKQAKADGLGTLGQFIYYDAMVMHGPGESSLSFGGIRRTALRQAKTPTQGGDEAAYLNGYLDAREAAMRTEAAHSDTSRIDTAQRVFLKQKNFGLELPMSWQVYGEKFRVEKLNVSDVPTPSISTPISVPSTFPLKKGEANGTESFLNRGIEEKTGWNPPYLGMADLHTISLDEFCRIFPPAAKYKPFFVAASQKHRLNPTLLAAMAMEESHCDPSVSDGGNAANAGGIMQIQGQDKAGSSDPATNIMQGALELRHHLDDAKGNVIEAIGSYNGWQRGLVVKTMIHPPWGGASMNLDYIHQILNGWCQGVEGYEIGNFNTKYNPSFGEQFR